MQYEELKEKASKGPFDMKLTPEGYYIDDKDGKPIAWEVGTLNAQLIAHTLNHFDKLLEALGEIERIDFLLTAKFPEDLKGITAILNKAYKTLKEAKEVAQ